MIESNFRALWTRETRSRAFGTVLMAFVAVAAFYSLFYDRIGAHLYFNTVLAIGAAIQIGRSIFLLRFSHLEDETWLKWNDFGICVYATFWAAFATGIAVIIPSSEALVSSTVLILTVGYISNASQFFAYRRAAYFFFMLSVVLPGSVIASNLSPHWHEKLMLALLPIAYAGFQLRTRKALWSAMQGIGRAQANLKEAIDSFPGGLVVLRNKEYHRVNHYAAHQLGRTEDQIVGQTLGFAESDNEFKIWVDEFVRSGKEIDSFEQTVKTKDGQREHFVVIRRSSQYRDDIILSSLDIEALAQAQRELDLERQRAHDVSRSVSGLAGEINAPLAALTEQVLVRQTPDLQMTRESLMRIQLVVNRIKAG